MLPHFQMRVNTLRLVLRAQRLPRLATGWTASHKSLVTAGVRPICFSETLARAASRSSMTPGRMRPSQMNLLNQQVARHGIPPQRPEDQHTLGVERVQYAIIGICSLILACWWTARYGGNSRNDKMLRRLADNTLLSWRNLLAGRWWTLLTSAVTHISSVHFLFNMFAFSAFCSVLSGIPAISGLRVLSISLQAGLVSSAAFLTYDWRRMSKQTPKNIRSGQACGLSGVNMGLAAVATCLKPHTPMMLMFIPIPVPLYSMVAGFIAMDVLFMGSNDSISHASHLGGFVFGFLYYIVQLRRLRIPGSILQTKNRLT